MNIPTFHNAEVFTTEAQGNPIYFMNALPLFLVGKLLVSRLETKGFVPGN